MMKVTYGPEFNITVPTDMVGKVKHLEDELRKMPQYEPITKHTFHAGMYCREVWRAAGVLVVGKVHKKEHFYMIASGTVVITTDDGVKRVTGPHLFSSMPGTKRAVFSETDALCMTFHRLESLTVEDAETELVEEEVNSMYDAMNLIKPEFREVLS